MMNANLAAKFLEVRRSSENQSARCKVMLKKLKTIQLQEIEEFGEKQFETVVKLLAEKKQVQLKEAVVPDFLQKRKPPVPPMNAFEPEDFLEPVNISAPDLDTKLGHTEIRDVSNMLRQNIKELLLSTGMIGRDDADTDSGSEYEDELQTKASLNYSTLGRREGMVYLPVEFNPAVNWARYRLDFIARFTWINDALRTVDQRINQQDQLLEYIKDHKPPFKFDETQPKAKPPTMNVPLNFSDVKYFREDPDKKRLTTDPSPNVLSFDPRTATTNSILSSFASKCTGAVKENLGKIASNAESYDVQVPIGDFGGGIESLMIKIFPRGGPVFDKTPSSRRCIPVTGPLRQRKVLQIGGIHNVVGKPEKNPFTLCSCFGRTELCIICSGRSDKIKRVRPGATPRVETAALLDHNYHKTLSFTEEKPLNMLAEAALKTASWNRMRKSNIFGRERVREKEYLDGRVVFLPTSYPRPKPLPTPPPSLEKPLPPVARVPQKKAGKGDRKTRKRKRYSDSEEEEEDEEFEMNWTPKKSQTSESKKRRTDGKYDIDHIVIPYSIAAATRVEKIEYKEIVIPSWRINEVEPLSPKIQPKVTPRSTRASRSSGTRGVEEETEDISPDAVHARHLRSELDEKKRFMNAMNVLSNRRNRKSETKAENSDLSLPSSPIAVETLDSSFPKGEEVVPATPNQISAADASLAVTALKIAAPSTMIHNVNPRRRTVSACKVEEDDNEERGVSPFEPRQFPLSEDEFATMVNEMQESYQEEEQQEAHLQLQIF